MKIADIEGFPNYYISIDGVVRRKELKRKSDSLIVKQFISNNGYSMVSLRENGIKKNRTVHSLILCSFCGDKRELGFVSRHIDGNKLNNHIDNLEWGTISENHNDKKRHGTFQQGESHGMHTLTNDIVKYIKQSKESCLILRKKFNITEGAVYSARTGWKHLNSEQATERALGKVT